MMLAVDFYIDLSMLRNMAFDNIMLNERNVKACWFSWMVLTLWPVMMFVGCVVQFVKTARDFDHRHGKSYIFSTNNIMRWTILFKPFQLYSCL